MNLFSHASKQLTQRSSHRPVRRASLATVALCLYSAACCSAAAPQLRTLNVIPATQPPLIDGKLNDACWISATVASAFTTTGSQWPLQQTTALVTYDDDALYVAFDCAIDRGATPQADTALPRDDHAIFLGDTVELFIDALATGRQFYHFAASPAGTQYDARCDVRGDDLDRQDAWNPPWEVATAVTTDHWTAEIRVPFTALGAHPPTPGQVWRINLARTRQTNLPRAESSSWAGSRVTFNRPEDLGRLVFGAEPELSLVVHSFKASAAGNELALQLTNHSRQAMKLDIERAITVDAGEQRTLNTPVDLAAGQTHSLLLTYHASSNDNWFDVPVELANSATMDLRITTRDGRPLDTIRGGWSFDPAVPLDLALDRFYYTPDVQTAQLDITATDNAAAAVQVQLRREQQNRQPLFSTRIDLDDQNQHELTIPLSDLSTGRFIVTAELLDADGQRLASVHRALLRREISPAASPPTIRQVSLRDDGILLLNGQPFFAFLASTSNEAPPFARDAFNVAYRTDMTVENPLQRINLDISSFAREADEPRFLVPPLSAWVEQIAALAANTKNNERLLYWLLKYEGDYPLYEAQGRVRLDNVEAWKKVNAAVKHVDADHPTALHIEGTQYEAYSACADILEVALPSSYAVHLIDHLVDELQTARTGLGPNKGLVVWLGASLPEPAQRSAEEIRAACYLAMMNGATGIVFHMGHGGIGPQFTQLWSVFPGLAREMTQTFPILSSQQNIAAVNVAITQDFERNTIEWRVRRHDNSVYLVAVNTSPLATNANFVVEVAGYTFDQVNLPLEQRSIPAENGIFRDVFLGYEPHLYKLIAAP
jgi:hypothetical protein